MTEKKIMLVDDEERFLETTAKLLTRKGYEVVTASRGEEALEKLETRSMPTVVLDVKMPGLGGRGPPSRRLKSVSPWWK